jgi:hypothetical protein
MNLFNIYFCATNMHHCDVHMITFTMYGMSSDMEYLILAHHHIQFLYPACLALMVLSQV